MTATLLPWPRAKFFAPNTNYPLAGGKVYTYAAGTTTPLATYSDVAGTIPNTNPVILDANGEAAIYLGAGLSYKINVTDASDVQVPGYPVDNLYGYLAAIDLANTSNVNLGDALVGVKRTTSGAIATTQHNFNEFADFYLKRDFGAVGDGVTDDTTKVQAFLDACKNKRGVIESGYTFLCDPLVIRSGTTLSMYGSTIKALSTLPNTSALLINETTTGTVNTYYDHNISIFGGCFDGNNVGDSIGSRTASLLAFIKAKNILLQDSRVTNVNYIGVGFSGCLNIRITGNELDDIGNPTTGLPVAGPALWFGNAADTSQNYYVDIENNFIHDCNESSMNLGANYVKVSNNFISNVKESGMFAASPFLYHQYIGNVINGVTRTTISSSGIECGASFVQIIGNYIANTQSDSISLTDAQVVVIANNELVFPARDSAYFPQASEITIITTKTAPNQPRDIVIEGNKASSASPNAYAFVHVGNAGDAPANVRIQGNGCDGQVYTNPSGRAIYVDAGKRSSTFFAKDNKAGEDNGPIVKHVTITAATGNQSITGIGFRPSSITILSTVTSTTDVMQSSGIIDCTLTAGGTKCNYLASGAAGNRASTIDGNIINLVSPAGTNQVIATVASIDEDGFTINKTTAAVAAESIVACYP